nr:phenylalanine--tRNA ligase alpha subunit, cytoplasmic [Tanacetum cinerariifolium]
MLKTGRTWLIVIDHNIAIKGCLWVYAEIIGPIDYKKKTWTFGQLDKWNAILLTQRTLRSFSDCRCLKFKELFTPYGFVANFLSLENYDALFTTPLHPARYIQDTFFLKDPPTKKTLPEDYVQRVKTMHEIKNMLRSHTTDVSVKMMCALVAKNISSPNGTILLTVFSDMKLLIRLTLQSFIRKYSILWNKYAGFLVTGPSAAHLVVCGALSATEVTESVQKSDFKGKSDYDSF